MPKKTNTEADQFAEFDLKHRVTGAAVLLFLGALVLPWLLGPPSEASKVEVAQQSPMISEVEVANIVTTSSNFDPISANSYGPEPLINEIEETVYISKITPLDAKGNSDLVKAAKAAAESTKVRQQQDETNALAKIVKQQNQALEKTAAEKTSVENVVTGNSDKQDQPQTKTEVEIQTPSMLGRKPQLINGVAKKPSSANKAIVQVGWIVQVGLFTEKSRAIALISELKRKGFAASGSVVDTNRGKKTGTRVWIGPFGKRVAAINQQKMLKAKAGKEGFIRVYP